MSSSITVDGMGLWLFHISWKLLTAVNLGLQLGPMWVVNIDCANVTAARYDAQPDSHSASGHVAGQIKSDMGGVPAEVDFRPRS